MTAAPQLTDYLPKLSLSLSGSNSLLTPASLVPTPNDTHVTKRPGRVTDDTIVVQASDTTQEISSLHGPPDDISSAYALSNSTESNAFEQFETHLEGARKERSKLRRSYQMQQALIEDMRAELKEVNERWEAEKPKRPPSLNPPDVIHTGSQASPRRQNAPSTDSRPPSPDVIQTGS